MFKQFNRRLISLDVTRKPGRCGEDPSSDEGEGRGRYQQGPGLHVARIKQEGALKRANLPAPVL